MKGPTEPHDCRQLQKCATDRKTADLFPLPGDCQLDRTPFSQIDPQPGVCRIAHDRHGRFIKGVLGTETKVIYISTCIAGKFEVQAAESSSAIDVVLTYHEIDKFFKSRGINPASLARRRSTA